MAQQNPDYPLDDGDGKRPNGSRKTNDLGDNAQEMAEKFAGQAQEYAEKAQEAVRNFKPYVEKSMKERPMGTLAAAAIIGFVLGALWKK
ncbi:MAG TPA: hypothetical protein VG742_14095 [Dongiaceae bacterium]|jgi:ElaB/YqjD/DUF883 family membrane-anchored ribosome-binding protein|nr:hypothetical protein [Dongiaceae bacterium]